MPLASHTLAREFLTLCDVATTLFALARTRHASPEIMALSDLATSQMRDASDRYRADGGTFPIDVASLPSV